MFRRYDFNEYGTPVTVGQCDTCGEEFTVCPKADERRMAPGGDWANCLATDCASYDPRRDADKFFDESPEAFIRVPAEPMPTA